MVAAFEATSFGGPSIPSSNLSVCAMVSSFSVCCLASSCWLGGDATVSVGAEELAGSTIAAVDDAGMDASSV